MSAQRSTAETAMATGNKSAFGTGVFGAVFGYTVLPFSCFNFVVETWNARYWPIRTLSLGAARSNQHRTSRAMRQRARGR